MKTISKLIIFSFLLTAFIAVSFSACKKDTTMTVVITVKMRSDTNIVVPDANVYIRKGEMNVEGISDINGQFRQTYKLEAIFDVTAIKQIDPTTSISGTTVVRLVPGQTVYKSVFVN